MTVEFQQMDTNAEHGSLSACSGVTVTSDTPKNAKCQKNGAAGSASETVSIQGYAFLAEASAIFFESEPFVASGTVDVPAGDWSFTLNVTSGNANLTVSKCHLCRMNSSGLPLSTLKSITPGQALTSAQEYEFTFPSVAGVTFNAGDRFYIVVSMTNAQQISGQSITVVFDGVVSVPLPDDASSIRRRRG